VVKGWCTPCARDCIMQNMLERRGLPGLMTVQQSAEVCVKGGHLNSVCSWREPSLQPAIARERWEDDTMAG